MKRYLFILFALFCFSPTGHAQESEPPRTITLDRRAERPAWSPDSRYIAFLAVDEEYDTNVQVVEVSTGQIIADFDYEPDVIVWSPDSTRLAINADKNTGEQEFSISARDVPVTILNLATGSETTIGRY
jgi:dipeptidyl aminopeptidase/acylaminoacyl peptidase